MPSCSPISGGARCVPNAPDEPAQKTWEPLDLPTIEPKPKKVVLDDNFAVNVSLDDRQEADYVRIRSLIATGGDLKRFYRASTKHDRLLKSHQVLHLHLGGPASDAILYVVQYPTYILFVCIDTHVHLESTPPGIRLPVLGRRQFEAGSPQPGPAPGRALPILLLAHLTAGQVLEIRSSARFSVRGPKPPIRTTTISIATATDRNTAFVPPTLIRKATTKL